MASKAKKHAEIEKLEFAGLTWNFSPTALIVYARHFLDAAKTAADLPFNPARTFLACRSVELALKALLALRGVSLPKLSTGAFGHNLHQLLAEADKNNIHEFVKLNSGQRTAIKHASDYYREKVLEYPALSEAVHAYPKMPNTPILIEASELLVTSLHQPCVENS
jgi:HEPN domain-containing protein